MSQRQESQLLDEDLCNKITYHPECQATFRAYKKILRSKILIVVLMLVFFVTVSTKTIYELITEGGTIEVGMPKDFMHLVVGFFVIAAFILLGYLLIVSIRDLLALKLDIVEDIVRTITPSDNNDYYIEFEKSGTLYASSSVPNKKIPLDKKVYVIRTIYSKTLLDVIPIENINIAP